MCGKGLPRLSRHFVIFKFVPGELAEVSPRLPRASRRDRSPAGGSAAGEGRGLDSEAKVSLHLQRAPRAHHEAVTFL